MFRELTDYLIDENICNKHKYRGVVADSAHIVQQLIKRKRGFRFYSPEAEASEIELKYKHDDDKVLSQRSLFQYLTYIML